MRIEFFKFNLPLKITREKHIKGDFSSFFKELKPVKIQKENSISPLNAKTVEREYIINVAKEKAQKYKVPLNIVLAIIEQESNFNPRAYNKNKDGSEDIGLMQVNFKHNKRLMEEYGINSPQELYDIEKNIELGVRILSENYKRFKSWELAIKAYNGIRADNWNYVKSVLKKAEKYVNL